MDLRAHLRAELARRVARNRRYSLRAFARTLGTHHSTLTRILDGRRRLTAGVIERIGTRAGLSPEQVVAARAEEHARRIIELARHPRFRPDCRWLAMMSGLELDDVNRALHHAIRTRRLVLRSATTWVVSAP